ncbi:MAG: efflux RND transporter periplasmic adaptor subunit [Proteobacteria bacterium]|nr:efflux RND transporter periplasmic adaptor subunit [Pseudomonadota bacterium]
MFERPRANTALIVLLAFASAGMICEKEQPPAKQRIRAVKYYRITAAGGPLERTFSGVSEAGLESNLSFKVTGNVTKLGVKVGDKVKKRSFIAQLDKTDYRLRLKQAKAAQARARAQRRNSKSEYDRVRALYANQNASRSRLDSTRARYESARANSSSAAQAVKLAKQQLEYTRLTAPISGAIADVLVEANENIKAGQPIVKLASGKKPKVTVAVPEGLIGRVKQGSDVQVSFEAISGKTFVAVVSEVAVSSNTAEAAFPVTVILATADDQIRPGMAADVTFRFQAEEATDSSRFMVPPSAVGQDREGRFVFVVEAGEEGKFIVRRRAVEVSEELTREGLQILSGVKEDERVVTAGLSKMEDGMQVLVREADETVAQ